MRVRMVLVVICVALLAGACTPWHETFDRWDPKRWYPQRWFADDCAAGATQGELQWYTDRIGVGGNVSVDNGILDLVAREAPYLCRENNWGGMRRYTGGWVQTGGANADRRVAPGAAFTYGYVEVRFQFPRGRGLWPAIWLLPADFGSRPEIDILEVRGDRPSDWNFHVHFDGVDTGRTVRGPDTSAGWHTAGLLWTKDELVFVMDGNPAWRYTGPGIPKEPMYLVMNLAVDERYGPPDPAAFPAHMRVSQVSIGARSFSSRR